MQSPLYLNVHNEKASLQFDNQPSPLEPDLCPSLSHVSVRGQKRAVWYEPVTSLKIQGPKVVWWVWRSGSIATSQEQRVGNHVYLFRTCEHADTARIWQTAAILQEGGEK